MNKSQSLLYIRKYCKVLVLNEYTNNGLKIGACIFIWAVSALLGCLHKCIWAGCIWADWLLMNLGTVGQGYNMLFLLKVKHGNNLSISLENPNK